MSHPTQDNSAPQTLEYATFSPRRIWVRRILFATVAMTVVAAGICAYLWREDISFRVRRVYWYRQCLAHVTPPGTVLLEKDPVKARALIDSNPDYVDLAKHVPFLAAGMLQRPAAYQQ